jgi:hypothetical protein
MTSAVRLVQSDTHRARPRREREHVRTLRRRRQFRRAVPLLPRQLHRQGACRDSDLPARAMHSKRHASTNAFAGADTSRPPLSTRLTRLPSQPQLENGDKGAREATRGERRVTRRRVTRLWVSTETRSEPAACVCFRVHRRFFSRRNRASATPRSQTSRLTPVAFRYAPRARLALYTRDPQSFSPPRLWTA